VPTCRAHSAPQTDLELAPRSPPQTAGLNRPRTQEGPVCLVLAPTRELVQQIQLEAVKFGQSSGIVCAEVYGGVSKGPQIGQVMRGVHMICATPGRMNDFLTTKRYIYYIWIPPAAVNS